MIELQEKINSLTTDKTARYFYHFTSVDADKILDEGLIVANPLWQQSFLEFTESELNDIESVIKENGSTKLKNNYFMIIAGVYEDNMEYFIRKLNDEENIDVDWEGVGNPDYIVDSNHLMGYADLDSLELIVNDYANVIGDDFNL